MILADGRAKKIEDVRTGDKVLATDPTTGKTEAREVTDLIRGQGEKRMVEITVASGGKTKVSSGL